MAVEPRLIREIEIGAAARQKARAIRQVSARLRAMRSGLSRADVASLTLVAIAEHLIDAHALAQADGEGSTIDVVSDALHHVGKRLARETDADSPSARAIIGYYQP